MLRRLPSLLMLAALWLALPLGAAPAPPPLPPEAERDLKACVMGLDPADGDYFGLPHFEAKVAHAHGWDQQLYWLDFELSHGCLMRMIPAEAKIFMACPEVHGAKESREANFFKAYLRQRAGWDERRVAATMHFFKVYDPLIWTQDFSLQAGRGPLGQRRLNVGPEDASVYRKFADALVKSYPGHFSLNKLPKGVSGEGGDLAMARFGDGQQGIILGRHRVKHYFEAMGWPWTPGQVVSAERVAEIEGAYAAAYGQRALICPKAPLLEGWGSEELFHLDMVVSFLPGTPSAAVVPQMTGAVIDRASGQPLDPGLVAAMTREYGAVADELQSAGFKVLRAPFDDHPARSPTNTVKYRSAQSAKRMLFLAHYARPDSPAVGDLHKALDHLNAVAVDVHAKPSADQVKEVDAALAGVWGAMHVCDLSPDASFDAQAAVYREAGMEVVPVPDYPWGAGSLHCQFLH